MGFLVVLPGFCGCLGCTATSFSLARPVAQRLSGKKAAKSSDWIAGYFWCDLSDRAGIQKRHCVLEAHRQKFRSTPPQNFLLFVGLPQSMRVLSFLGSGVRRIAEWSHSQACASPSVPWLFFFFSLLDSSQGPCSLDDVSLPVLSIGPYPRLSSYVGTLLPPCQTLFASFRFSLSLSYLYSILYLDI